MLYYVYLVKYHVNAFVCSKNRFQSGKVFFLRLLVINHFLGSDKMVHLRRYGTNHLTSNDQSVITEYLI